MKEHAIPQDITGYKFHIVGNMTLKQFAEVAIGFVVAFFIYKTNLYFPIKWLLIAFFAAFGAALAFLPIQERPLDHWFITFFSIIYNPTKFYWKREAKIPEVFSYKSKDSVKKMAEIVDLSPQRQERIKEYLQSVKTTQDIDQEEIQYQQRSAQLLSIFSDKSLKIDYSRHEKVKQKPNLKVQVRSLIGVKEELIVDEVSTTVSQTTEVEKSYELETIDSNLEKQSQEYKPVLKKTISVKNVAAEISIPETENVHVEEIYKNEKISVGGETIKQNEQTQEEQEEVSYIEDVTQTDTSQQESTHATVNKDLPFPTKPSKPNKIVGMTLTRDNDLINNATLTIRNKENKPITAVRSNALGQFFITSQLENGTYNIIVKKDGFSFYPLTIELEGKIMDPIEIRSNE